MPNKSKMNFLTPSLKRFILLNVSIFLFIIVLFNILLISITNYVLHTNLDKRLLHEAEKVVAGLDVQDSSITILDFSELEEPDFQTITDNPYFLQIYNPTGEILISSGNIKHPIVIPVDIDSEFDNNTFENLSIDGERLRVGYFPLYTDTGNKVAILQLATVDNEFKFVLTKIITFNLFLLPVIIILVLFASIFIGKKSLSPINNIIKTAEKISAKSLTSRIEIDAHPDDELGRLRDTLNGLFDRIESYVNQLAQFTDHASHQLMNPLTAVKTELEYILKKDRTTDEYKESLRQLLKQTDNMVKIVKTLLMLSKQDKNSKQSISIFNLSKLIVSNTPEQINSHTIELHIEPNIYIKGDAEKFAMVVENLIDNAVKYSPNNETIKVFLKKTDEEVEFRVEDKGIGIKDSDKEKIFERFYRSSTSEKIGVRGYGLGLSLVKTILLEMGAKIKIDDNQPSGSKFIITLKALKIEE